MHMSFWWDFKLGDYFIDGIKVDSISSMILACGFTLIISIVFEGLKVIETKLHQENNLRLKNSSIQLLSDDRNNLLQTTNSDMQNPTAGPSTQSRPFPRREQLNENTRWTMTKNILVFTTNNTIKYLMMLNVMLFNGYLTVSVILGIVLGYFIFGSIGFFYYIKSVIQQKRTKTTCLTDCEENENGTTPPLIHGRASSSDDIQTCEFEVHRRRESDVSEDIDIRVIQSEQHSSDVITRNSLSNENEHSKNSNEDISEHKTENA